jgi:hypothetical protein
MTTEGVASEKTLTATQHIEMLTFPYLLIPLFEHPNLNSMGFTERL